jgi:hypothetical protein
MARRHRLLRLLCLALPALALLLSLLGAAAPPARRLSAGQRPGDVSSLSFLLHAPERVAARDSVLCGVVVLFSVVCIADTV